MRRFARTIDCLDLRLPLDTTSSAYALAGRERRDRHRIIALADLSPFPRESRLRAPRRRTRIVGRPLVVGRSWVVGGPLGRLGILGNGLSNRDSGNSIALAAAVDLRPYH